MKKKLKELITSPTTTRRLGDFICNFTAVVLGIIITFIGSDMIQEHNKKKEVTQALQLVKSELLINKEIIEDMRELEIFNKQGARYLLQYKDRINETSSDSLNYYNYFLFQSRDFLPLTDAMEMLSASSLMQNIESKELVVQIIQAYAVIKNSHKFYEGFSKTKENMTAKLTDRQDFQEFSNKDKTTLRETWNFVFNLPEGLAAIRQSSYIHDDPQLTYSHHLELIDETIKRIDKEY